MKFSSYILVMWLILTTSAAPQIAKDTEVMQDASIPQESLLQLETMIEKDTSVENSAVEEGVRDGEDEEDDHDNKTSELLGFNFPLFPASSIFGANAMFQKLQESLRVIRDQLNTLWGLSDDSHPSFDVPDDYVNSTSYSKVINGTLVTVNETFYKTTNEIGVQSFHHTKVISLHPDNETDVPGQKQNLISRSTPQINFPIGASGSTIIFPKEEQFQRDENAE